MIAHRRRQPIVPKTAIRRAWQAMDERGLAVTGMRITPTGEIFLLTEAGAAPVTSDAALDAEIEALMHGDR